MGNIPWENHNWKKHVYPSVYSSSVCNSQDMEAREGNGNPLQYSCLENPMDGGAWWAAVHGVAEGRTWLKDFTFTLHFTRWRRKWQPLQCSCLENPRDGGAWWAAVYGVTQSRTRLKRLSSSSSSRTWKQPRCLSSDEWIKKLWYIYTMKY